MVKDSIVVKASLLCVLILVLVGNVYLMRHAQCDTSDVAAVSCASVVKAD